MSGDFKHTIKLSGYYNGGQYTGRIPAVRIFVKSVEEAYEFICGNPFPDYLNEQDLISKILTQLNMSPTILLGDSTTYSITKMEIFSGYTHESFKRKIFEFEYLPTIGNSKNA